MTIFKAVDYGYSPDALVKSSGGFMYRPVTVTWTEPRLCSIERLAPLLKDERKSSFLYAVTYHPPRARKHKDRIVYIGLTTRAGSRFTNHHFIQRKIEEGGHVKFSVGSLSFKPLRGEDQRPSKGMLEELEHIFIWTAWPHLENDKKQRTVPGQGLNGGSAWSITNEGHSFDGQLPGRVVFPWLITS